MCGRTYDGAKVKEGLCFAIDAARLCSRTSAFADAVAKEFTELSAFAYPLPNRVQEHIRLLGILWLALSALNAVAGPAMGILAKFVHLHKMGAPPETPAGFLQSRFSAIGTVILAKAACGFIAGWGLLRRAPWARMPTIVLSFLALFHIPLGTALGIYSLWVRARLGDGLGYVAAGVATVFSWN